MGQWEMKASYEQQESSMSGAVGVDKQGGSLKENWLDVTEGKVLYSNRTPGSSAVSGRKWGLARSDSIR